MYSDIIKYIIGVFSKENIQHTAGICCVVLCLVTLRISSDLEAVKNKMETYDRQFSEMHAVVLNDHAQLKSIIDTYIMASRDIEQYQKPPRGK